jgi:hypothetical protein
VHHQDGVRVLGGQLQGAFTGQHDDAGRCPGGGGQPLYEEFLAAGQP